MRRALLATGTLVTAMLLAPAAPAAAGTATPADRTPASAGAVPPSFGTYAVNRGSVGIHTTPYTVIASVSSGGGQNTLSITGAYSVAKAATFTTGITVAQLSANLGFSQTGTTTVTVGCSYNTNGVAGVLTAYPRSNVVRYDVYARVLGGGTANDRYVGSGQFNQPVGFDCQFRRY